MPKRFKITRPLPVHERLRDRVCIETPRQFAAWFRLLRVEGTGEVVICKETELTEVSDEVSNLQEGFS